MENYKRAIEIGKIGFEEYIYAEGAGNINGIVAQQFGIDGHTLRRYTKMYINNPDEPNPTKEDIEYYNGLVNIRRLIRKAKSTKATYNKAFIDKVLSFKYFGDLMQYLLESDIPAEIMKKELSAACNDNSLDYDDLNLIEKTLINVEFNEEVKYNGLPEVEKQRLKEEKIEKENTARIIHIICDILAEVLVCGFTNREFIIKESEISEETFEKYLPYLQEGNEIQRGLYKRYMMKVEKQKELPKDPYTKMMDEMMAIENDQEEPGRSR